MTSKMITSPVKTQGRKTRLVPWLSSFTDWYGGGKWIEPFMGSCQVALAFAPTDGAIMCDDNPHLVRLCVGMRDGTVNRESVKAFMEKEGKSLRTDGKAHYVKVHDRFNRSHDPHDLLFLNHAGFNGLMRWNKSGRFNSSYGQRDAKFDRRFVSTLPASPSSIILERRSLVKASPCSLRTFSIPYNSMTDHASAPSRSGGYTVIVIRQKS